MPDLSLNRGRPRIRFWLVSGRRGRFTEILETIRT